MPDGPRESLGSTSPSSRAFRDGQNLSFLCVVGLDTPPFTGYKDEPKWRHGQVVRQRSAKPPFPGSNPGAASRRTGLERGPFFCLFSRMPHRTFRNGRRRIRFHFPWGHSVQLEDRVRCAVWETYWSRHWPRGTFRILAKHQNVSSSSSSICREGMLRSTSGHESVHSPPLVGPREKIRPKVVEDPSSCCLRIALPVQSLSRVQS